MFGELVNHVIVIACICGAVGLLSLLALFVYMADPEFDPDGEDDLSGRHVYYEDTK